MGMTIAEKILAKKSGQAKVAPGDLVTVEVDTVVLIDNSFTAGRWREINHVRDPQRIVVVFDHRVPASTQDSASRVTSHAVSEKSVGTSTRRMRPPFINNASGGSSSRETCPGERIPPSRKGRGRARLGHHISLFGPTVDATACSHSRLYEQLPYRGENTLRYRHVT